MSTKLISFALISILASAQKQYVATFENNNIVGSVVVDNGHVSVTLDLSGEPSLPGSFEECISNGLTWHIHEYWNHDDTADKIGATDCGPAFTGGHFDPWNACGPNTGNKYCMTTSNTYNYSCIPTTSYVPAFPTDPFSVEVGDWSNKYGKIVFDDTNYTFPMTTFSSFYEVTSSEVVGLNVSDMMSVVFHCTATTNTQRAFCAPFLESTSNLEFEKVDQVDGDNEVVAEFGVLSAVSEMKLFPDGTVTAILDPTEIYDPLNAACSKYQISIWNPSSSKLLGSKSGSMCKDYVDSQYDPTHQCLPWSDSEYCSDGILCGDPDYEYQCDFITDRFSCSPSDLSGIFDIELSGIEELTLQTLDYQGPATLIPPTKSLIGKIIGIHCSYQDAADTEFLACASIDQYVESGINKISVISVFVISFIALLLH